MMHEAIMAAISIIVLFVSLGLLALSVWKKKRFTSEAAWDKLVERFPVLRLMFALSVFSLVLYLFAESAELMNLQSPSSALEGVHEIGETVHMFIAAIAVLVALSIVSAMLGGEDAL